MITLEKVEEYTWCNGDSDGYSRSKRWKRNIITDEEWQFIDKVVSEIGLIRKGLVSASFEEAHKKKIANFDSKQTYQFLIQYESNYEPDGARNRNRDQR